MSKNTKNLFVALVVVLAAVGLVLILVFSADESLPETTNTQVSSVGFSTSELIIDVDAAYLMQEEGAFLLDVRTVEEWDQVHIPGAVLIPLDELQARSNELPGDQDIVIYCRSGNRSAQALNVLLNAGFSNVFSMSGGINDWIRTGYPVE